MLPVEFDVEKFWFDGTVLTGAVECPGVDQGTRRVKILDPKFPAASVAVHVTVVVPTG